MQNKRPDAHTFMRILPLQTTTRERIQRPIWLSPMKWLKNRGKNEEENDPSKKDSKEKKDSRDDQEMKKNNGHGDQNAKEGGGEISDPGAEDICPNKNKPVQRTLKPKEVSRRLSQ